WRQVPYGTAMYEHSGEGILQVLTYGIHGFAVASSERCDVGKSNLYEPRIVEDVGMEKSKTNLSRARGQNCLASGALLCLRQQFPTALNGARNHIHPRVVSCASPPLWLASFSLFPWAE